MTIHAQGYSRKVEPNRAGKRQILLETALRLFNEHGYANVGVDWIVSEAKIAKPTLYSHFGTKNGLIEEVLKLRDENFVSSLQSYVDQAPQGALTKVGAILEWYKNGFTKPNFFGCMFIKASEEFGNSNANISEIIKQHKDSIYKIIYAAILPEYDDKTEDIAVLILILLEGLIVNYNMYGSLKPFDVATETVRKLLLR
ncbi:TetR/AcrR family transcriptional regulator [uncultured Bartonella sp.]|uniref:TetR/AcrR family transcriptional regulator n=1 Tax=uncultured Bartonella sp. TaxID=104108 RepID=UPI002639275C|nr:TetR/AcrR family transcriptional regulator [uncultured Bartonella sp.]